MYLRNASVLHAQVAKYEIGNAKDYAKNETTQKSTVLPKQLNFVPITDTGSVGDEQGSVGARLEDNFLVCCRRHFAERRRLRVHTPFQLTKLEALSPEKKSHDFDGTRWTNSSNQRVIVKT